MGKGGNYWKILRIGGLFIYYFLQGRGGGVAYIRNFTVFEFSWTLVKTKFFLPCSIDDDLNVKVTDCALSRDLFPQDYCCLGDNENRPVKWMAVESLEHGRYTVASDAVSKKIRVGRDGVSGLDTDHLKRLKTPPTSRKNLFNFSKL